MLAELEDNRLVIKTSLVTGDWDDPIASAVALSWGLSESDVRVHGRVLARGDYYGDEEGFKSDAGDDDHY